MNTPAEFPLTADHIRLAHRGDCGRCALALAAQEATGAEIVKVTGDRLYLYQLDSLTGWLQPAVSVSLDFQARLMILAFDATGQVRPGKFVVSDWKQGWLEYKADDTAAKVRNEQPYDPFPKPL